MRFAAAVKNGVIDDNSRPPEAVVHFRAVLAATD